MSDKLYENELHRNPNAPIYSCDGYPPGSIQFNESWHTDAHGMVVMRWEINGKPMDIVTPHPRVPVIVLPPDYAPGGDTATIRFNPGNE